MMMKLLAIDTVALVVLVIAMPTILHFGCMMRCAPACFF
jgi:hypothetical protein